MTLITPGNKILIMGEGHNVVQQFPMFKTPGRSNAPLRWWHERGRIHWEDARPREERPAEYYGSMSWRQCAERLLNLSAMVTKSSENGDYADERRRMQKFIVEMEPLLREAKEFGDLHDRSALRDHARRRPKSVVVPGRLSNVVAGQGGADHLTPGQRKMVDPFRL